MNSSVLESKGGATSRKAGAPETSSKREVLKPDVTEDNGVVLELISSASNRRGDEGKTHGKDKRTKEREPFRGASEKLRPVTECKGTNWKKDDDRHGDDRKAAEPDVGRQDHNWRRAGKSSGIDKRGEGRDKKGNRGAMVMNPTVPKRRSREHKRNGSESTRNR